jgi:prepilin-type processing-associated H-X9-DG protein
MYCSKCGVENSDHSTHCVNCGEILTAGGQASVPVQAVEAKNSKLAVAAFVMGLLCLTCVLWPILMLPAIICGIIALIKISGHKPYLKGTGMAVTGIIIPAVMILLIPVMAMLLAIFMPALAKTKTIAQRVVCSTNLKSLSKAMFVYTNEYDGRYPTAEQWCDLLMQEADAPATIFGCPQASQEGFSYAINKDLYQSKAGQADAQMVMLFEADLGRNGVGGPEDAALRHEEHGRLGCNILFLDGHVEFVTEDRIRGLKWRAE